MANDLQRDLLQTRPVRSKKKKGPALFLLIGGIVVVIGVLVVVFVSLLAKQGSANTTVSTGTDGAKQQGAGGSAPPIYWQTLQAQFAQNVHLTVSQVKTKLASNVDIADIATQQGLTQSELHTTEINALQVAHDKLVALGNATQQDSDTDMAWWKGKDPSALNDNFKNWFLEH